MLDFKLRGFFRSGGLAAGKNREMVVGGGCKNGGPFLASEPPDCTIQPLDSKHVALLFDLSSALECVAFLSHRHPKSDPESDPESDPNNANNIMAEGEICKPVSSRTRHRTPAAVGFRGAVSWGSPTFVGDSAAVRTHQLILACASLHFYLTPDAPLSKHSGRYRLSIGRLKKRSGNFRLTHNRFFST